jgi:hypothetical protein
MARLARQRALEPTWIDAMFCRECGTQYTRELLLSTVVELMLVVAAELWIANHNFSTRTILCGWQARGCGFIVRERSRTPSPQALEELCYRGWVETGVVYEQAVTIDD